MSETLPQLLEARGWTQERLAIATGIRRTDINALARGRLEAGPGRLQRIAEALDVSVLDLGAPEAETDAAGRTIQERLEQLAAELAESIEQQARLNRKILTLQGRVRKLEARNEPPPVAAKDRA